MASYDYRMRSYHTTLEEFVYWTWRGGSDLTGEYSPYDPNDLDSIVVVEIFPIVYPEGETPIGTRMEESEIEESTYTPPDLDFADIVFSSANFPFNRITEDP